MTFISSTYFTGSRLAISFLTHFFSTYIYLGEQVSDYSDKFSESDKFDCTANV